MARTDSNPYRKGSDKYKAYNKGFKAGYSYHLDIELERIKEELEAIKLKQKLCKIAYNIFNKKCSQGSAIQHMGCCSF